MRVKRKLPYILVILLLIAYLLFMVLSSSSFGADIVDDTLGMLSFSKVRFASGRFPADTSNLSVVLQDGETSLLNQFTNLRSADFSGSSCYEEIVRWANAHPEVQVRYTVAFPNGTTVDNSAQAVTLKGLTHENAASAASLLKYLPNLNSIDLGSSSDSPSPITADDVALLRSAVPYATFNYTLSLLGRDISIDAETADLSGLSSSQLGEAVSTLSLLPNLKTIDFGKSGSSDLSLEQVTQLAQTFPQAAINYTFDIGGKSISLSDESVDLSSIKSSDIDSIVQILPYMTKLTYAKIGSEETNALSMDDIEKLLDTAPNCVFDYTMNFWGKQISLAAETLDLNHIQMADEGASVKQLLPYMRNCKTLDMDSCMVSNQAMAAIRDEFPDIEVIWRVNFGDNYSVRTNVVKILASKPSKGGAITNSDANQLKYCTKVRYLDLGHNEELTDLSFIKYMPELEIAVISMTKPTTLEPFASCPNLLYLEAGNCGISDISPLASCTNLKHLNIGTNPKVSDMSCIYNLDLLRLWIGNRSSTSIPADQYNYYAEQHPDCKINTEVGSEGEAYTLGEWKYWQQATAEEWAADPLNLPQRPLGYWKVVYKAFQYNLSEAAYAFSWNDPMYDGNSDDIEPVNMIKIDTSFLSEYWENDPNNFTPDVLSDPPGNPID